jgi:hypothetical protein
VQQWLLFAAPCLCYLHSMPHFLPCLRAHPPAHPLLPVQEVAAYESAITRLEAEGAVPMEERQFQEELARAQDGAQRERWVHALLLSLLGCSLS